MTDAPEPSPDIQREDEPHGLRLELPATHAHGRMARQLAREFVESEGLPSGECDTVEFVVGELLDNAVDHGGGNAARELEDLPRDVRMTLLVQVERLDTEHRWRVAVGDQGGGEVAEVRLLLDPPDGIPDLDNDRGRGFFLLAQMVDELGVDPTPDGVGLEFHATRVFGPEAPSA